MIANSTIDLINLDPTLNKSSLIAYLETQPRFQGYSFAGDDMNIIIDLLGVNYFRYAFMLNLAISEGFIDSAQIFDNVKSHAKELNYLPNSSKSAYSNVTVSFNASGHSQPYIIPKGATFGTAIKNQNFVFSIAEPLIVASSNNSFVFTSDIYEGIYVKDSYIYQANPQVIPSFAITNANVDISSIVVNVFGGNSALIGQNYNLASSLLDLNGNSMVYFLQTAAANGNYEVLFGDGIFGNQPLNGSTIIIDYRISSGNLSNGSTSFSINFDPTGAGELTSPITIQTNQIAIGGAAPESIETTRFYAPRWFQVQERCIVPSDYEIVLTNKFSEIQAVNAYGGETLIPPQYGKVVIAVYINGVVGLPQSKIQQYTTFIKGYNPLSIQPIFVPASFSYLQINSLVKYNVNVSLESDATISAIVGNAINTYNNAELNDFDVTFYFSPFCDMIDEADPSIISNQTNVLMYQKIYPSQQSNNYYLNYVIPLMNNILALPSTHANSAQKTLSSSNFSYQGNLSQLEDDGAGTIRIVNLSGSVLSTAANVGVINYSNGFVQLSGLSVDSYSGDSLNIYVVPASDDITVTQNTILAIEPTQTQITIQQLSI
jgi:hypothetical protein